MSLGYSSRAARVAVFGLAVGLWCFVALGSQSAVAAPSWKRIATVTTLTSGQLCKNDGTNIICDSTTPTISSGNVGIGTTTPTNILSLGGDAARTVWMERGTVAATAGYALTLQAGGATSGATDQAGGDLVLSSGISTGTRTSNITFKTFPAGSTGTADGTATTAMTILGTGNVGIGTTNPSALLEVYGNDAGGTGARIRGQLVVKTNSGNLAQLQLVNTAASGHTWYMGNVWGGPEWGLRDMTAAGTPYRFLIDGSGNVGIGNTAPGSLLDIGKAGTTLGTLQLEGSTSGYVQIQPAAAAGSWTATLPATAGTSGQQLTTNGTGVLSWAAAGGATLDGTSATAWSSNPAIITGGPVVWVKLKNDGTTETRYTSMDGVTWVQTYTVALASSFLGSTGYNQVCLAMDNAGAGPNAVTLMSYQETSP